MLTHQHMDHIGLLEILARRSGARGGGDTPARALPGGFLAQRRGGRRVRPGGHAPPRDSGRSRHRARSADRGVSRLRVKRARHPSDCATARTLELRDRKLTHRPPARTQPVGHDLLGRAIGGILIAGDHLLAHISSNPLVSRPLSPTQPPPTAGAIGTSPASPAPVHRVDARHPRDARPARSCPATGTRSSTTAELIDERLRMHRRRARADPPDPRRRPAHAPTRSPLRMWGNVAVTQAYLTLSEVLGHLDLLVSNDQAVEHDSRRAVGVRSDLDFRNRAGLARPGRLSHRARSAD